MPMWEAPDEPDHYRLALYIARQNRLPPPGYSRETIQPPLYYWLASVPLRALDRVDPALADFYSPTMQPYGTVPRLAWNRENHRFVWGAQLLRWFNLLLGGAALHLIFSGARIFCPHPSALGLATISLIGLTPQYLHVSASVGNDALATLAGAYLFFLLCRVVAGPLRGSHIVFSLGIGLILPIATKLTVLPMGLTLLLAVLWKTRSRWPPLRSRTLLVAPLIVSGVLLLVSQLAPTFVSNLWSAIAWRGFSIRPGALESLRYVPRQLALSYWGLVGWMSVPLPAPLPQWLNALAAMGTIGSLRLLSTREEHTSDPTRPVAVAAFLLIVVGAAWKNTWFASAWAAVLICALYRSIRREKSIVLERTSDWGFVWLCIGISALAVLKNWLATPQAQGRFLFPSIGAISLMLTSGWIALLPQRGIAALPYLIMGILLGVNLFFWFTRVIPIYYQPWLG
jgi:hypothetical protein